MRRSVLVSIACAAVLVTAGCASSSGGGGGTTPAGASGPTGSSGSSAASCTPSTMNTRTSGELTVGTDSPAYAPWFINNDPSNGKGYESAVAYAVAKQLGYPRNKVKWVVASFNSVIAPTPKNFDFDINQVSITAQRKQAVDFSSGYYDVAQAVVALKGDKYAHVKTLSGFSGAKLGAQQGTTSFEAINSVIKPAAGSISVSEFPTNINAVQALKNGQIDGLVVDLPTGLYITAAQVHGSTIVGQLPVQGHPEQFGLVLDKGSSLTPCVTKAVNALRSNGTLAALQKKWLTTSAGAPVLH